MVRKRKKHEELKPWCFYCDREFNDENDLILHQKNKHFKCIECNKRLQSAKALSIHSIQVHKISIRYVPQAIEGRDDPSFEIFGSQGIPAGMKRGQNPPITMPPPPYGNPPYYPQPHHNRPPMPMPPRMPQLYGQRPPPPPYIPRGPPRPPYPPPGPVKSLPQQGYAYPSPPQQQHQQPFLRPPYLLPPAPLMGQEPTNTPEYLPHVIPNVQNHHPYPPPRGLPSSGMPSPPPPPEDKGKEASGVPPPPQVVHYGGGTELIWSEQVLSMEEKRASLPKYSSPLKKVT